MLMLCVVNWDIQEPFPLEQVASLVSVNERFGLAK